MICFPYEKLVSLFYLCWLGRRILEDVIFLRRPRVRCAKIEQMCLQGPRRKSDCWVAGAHGFLETASYEGMSVKQATYLKNGCFSGIISNCLVLEKPNLMHMYG